MEPEVTAADVAKAKRLRTAAQVEASRTNLLKSAGRPRIRTDYARAERMRVEGKTKEQIAAALGISRWTLRRRLVEQRELEEAFR